jgi:hypothetical protein
VTVIREEIINAHGEVGGELQSFSQRDHNHTIGVLGYYEIDCVVGIEVDIAAA